MDLLVVALLVRATTRCGNPRKCLIVPGGKVVDTIVQVIISGLLQGGVYGLVGVGLTIVFGVIRVTNFAHGDIMMLGMYLTYWLGVAIGLDPYVAFFVVLPVLFLFGVAMHRGLIAPLLDAPASMQMFATVGLGIVLQNLALLLFKADFRTVNTAYSSIVLDLGSISVSFPRLVAFLSAMAITAALFVFLKHTYLGKAIRGVSQDRRAAVLMGINVDQVYAITLGIGCASAGVAGALLMPIFYVYPTIGTSFVLAAFVVVVLGGLGNMVGALLGGLIIGVVEALSGYFISPALREAVYFILFISILLLKPSGLLGMVGAEEFGFKETD